MNWKYSRTFDGPIAEYKEFDENMKDLKYAAGILYDIWYRCHPELSKDHYSVTFDTDESEITDIEMYLDNIDNIMGYLRDEWKIIKINLYNPPNTIFERVDNGA